MSVKFLSILFCLVSCFSQAQNSWQPTNSPIVGRYDDVFFISKDTGRAVGNTAGGVVISTRDGGSTWAINNATNTYYRSIEFATRTKGFLGALNYNGNGVFFKTANGGNGWVDISSNAGGYSGICGICCVNASTIYAVGVYSSPAFVIKSINGGNTWALTNINEAAGLVDVQFLNGNIGYACGRSNIASEGGVIIKTTDGGLTWTKIFTTHFAGDYVWKLQNLDTVHWYASIQSNNQLKKFAYSNNSGATWQTKNVAVQANGYFQMIGFMDTLRGWTGYDKLYETNNGGNTWNKIDSMVDCNRFFKVNNSLAYFSGTKVYKFQQNIAGMSEISHPEIKTFSINAFPNPASSNFTINLLLTKQTMFNILIIDQLGKNIFWEKTGQEEKGNYAFEIDLRLPSGTYFVSCMTNEGIESKTIIVNN
jgi:photosystem II stability/assembly factor-like uncharacterized protein